MSQLDLFNNSPEQKTSLNQIERKGFHYRWLDCGCLYGTCHPNNNDSQRFDCPECAKWKAYEKKLRRIYWNIAHVRLITTQEGWDYGRLEDYCALSPLFWDVSTAIGKWIINHVYNEKVVVRCSWGCCNK